MMQFHKLHVCLEYGLCIMFVIEWMNDPYQFNKDHSSIHSFMFFVYCYMFCMLPNSPWQIRVLTRLIKCNANNMSHLRPLVTFKGHCHRTLQSSEPCFEHIYLAACLAFTLIFFLAACCDLHAQWLLLSLISLLDRSIWYLHKSLFNTICKL